MPGLRHCCYEGWTAEEVTSILHRSQRLALSKLLHKGNLTREFFSCQAFVRRPAQGQWHFQAGWDRQAAADLSWSTAARSCSSALRAYSCALLTWSSAASTVSSASFTLSNTAPVSLCFCDASFSKSLHAETFQESTNLWMPHQHQRASLEEHCKWIWRTTLSIYVATAFSFQKMQANACMLCSCITIAECLAH